MATLVKKHWRLMSIVALVFVCSATLTWHLMSERAALALQQAPQSLTDVQYNAVLHLLDDIKLDRDALVALNVSGSQASSVLSTVRGWYETNASTLQSLQNDINSKTRAVYDIEETIAMGPYDAANDVQLATARQDLANAKAAYQTALVPLKASVSTTLSVSQQTTWTAIQSGHGDSMPIRMLALNDTQRVFVGKAWRRYRYSYAAAATPEAQAAATAAWQTELNQILTTEQQTIVNNYNSNYDAASGVVANAWNTELVVGQEG